MSSIEGNLALTLAASYSGETLEVVETQELEKYNFDGDFQAKIASLMVRDVDFVQKTEGLIKPDYFEDSAIATIINLSQKYWETYRRIPADKVIFWSLVAEAYQAGNIRKELVPAIKMAIGVAYISDISDADYIAHKVGDFARHQAIELAMNKAILMIDKRQYDGITQVIKEAASVGINDVATSYEFFEKIEDRTSARRDVLAGVIKPKGITTGLSKIDDLLYHSGWGKQELSILMGGAKSGKSTGLLFFARNAAFAGHPTLYITLEMSAEIAASRIDASISEFAMKDLTDNLNAVEAAVIDKRSKSAPLHIVQQSGYSLTPAGLRRMVEHYRAKGVIFDLIVVDYLDLMAPDHRSNDSIENSKNIYVGVRAIGQENNIAILSATQTNREGFKSVIAKAEHAADDFNKIRIADLTISINATDDEKAANEARLHFAASRNEQSGMTVHISNDIEKMIFIKSVIGMI